MNPPSSLRWIKYNEEDENIAEGLQLKIRLEWNAVRLV